MAQHCNLVVTFSHSQWWAFAIKGFMIAQFRLFFHGLLDFDDTKCSVVLYL